MSGGLRRVDTNVEPGGKTAVVGHGIYRSGGSFASYRGGAPLAGQRGTFKRQQKTTYSCETIEGTRQTGAVYSRRGPFQQQAKEQCSEVGNTSRVCLNHLDESDGRRGRGLQCGPQITIELLRCEPCAPRRHEAPVLTTTRFEGWGGRTGQAQGRHRKREGTHRRERRDKTTFQRARRATSARAG